MLKILRKKKYAKKVWIGLAIIIIPAFALWGFGNAFRSRQESMPAGRIFGRDVSYLEYKDSLSAVTTMSTMRFGDKFDEMRKYLNLEEQAWDRLILLHEVDRSGIKASDKEVVDSIANQPFFQYKGVFNNRAYTQTLQYAFRLQPRVFEEQMRQNLRINKLYEQIVKDLKLSPEQIREEYEKGNQELSIYYIASLYADFAKKIKFPETQLKDYFAKNKTLFKKPAALNLAYINIVTEERAKDAKALMKKKIPVDKIIKELGLPVKETGLFGENEDVPGLNWPAESISIFTKLKIGEYAPLIQADKDYYLAWVKEKRESYIPDFEEAKEAVRAQLTRGLSEKEAENKIKECWDKLKSVDFNRGAKACGLTVKSTSPFKFDAELEGIGKADILWETAKALKENQYSQIIKLEVGFYIIKLKSASPLDEKKFLADKEEFFKSLIQRKKEDKFTAFIEELKKKAR